MPCGPRIIWAVSSMCSAVCVPERLSYSSLRVPCGLTALSLAKYEIVCDTAKSRSWGHTSRTFSGAQLPLPGLPSNLQECREVRKTVQLLRCRLILARWL